MSRTLSDRSKQVILDATKIHSSHVSLPPDPTSYASAFDGMGQMKELGDASLISCHKTALFVQRFREVDE